MRRIKFFSFLVFVLMLGFVLCEISYAAERKIPPGAIDQKQQKLGPTSGYADFKVKRVFISKKDAPNVPYAGPFYTNGDYTLACEISYTGRTNTTDPNKPGLRCIGTGSSAFVVLKVDVPYVEYDQRTGCLAPNESKTYFYPPTVENLFTAGNHTFECLIRDPDLPDLNADNNTKSISYYVIKPHNRTKPKRYQR